MNFQQMYSLYGLKHHLVEISGDVTDARRQRTTTTRENRATQLVISETLSLAIRFSLSFEMGENGHHFIQNKVYDGEAQWGGVDWAQICWTHSLPGFRIYLRSFATLFALRYVESQKGSDLPTHCWFLPVTAYLHSCPAAAKYTQCPTLQIVFIKVINITRMFALFAVLLTLSFPSIYVHWILSKHCLNLG